jgi:prepilin-type N-terminal cleavage/methylation domain-containing protein
LQGRPGPAHHGRDGRATHGRDAHATGFTLTEIMIAMGVLAVGMAMVAGALHAGIQVHIRTIDDIMRQLIGDNSLAMVQARVRHTADTKNGIPTDKYLFLGPNYFGSGDLKYPWNTVNIPNGQPSYGSLVFMKRRAIDATTSANDYDVIIVPYTIIPDTTGLGTVIVKDMLSSSVSAGTPGSTVTVTATNADVMKMGSVVIDSRSAQVSVVQSVTSTTKVVLRDTLTAGNGTGVTLTTMTVSNSSTGGRLECSKPVQTKTALSPAPGWTPGQ